MPARAAVATRTDVKPSPKLSILANGLPTMVGRLVGILVTDGASSELMDSLIEAVKAAEASVKIVAPKLDGVHLDNGSKLNGDFLLAGGPSVLFDTVAIVASEAGVDTLLGEAAAVAWVHDAFLHLKVIGHSPEVADLLDVAGVEADEGIVALVSNDATACRDITGRGPKWRHEARVRTVY